ncbi:hypothetical protein H6F43_03580 [Leptolyngbya sp. FACHB-36]|uniref:hypothetical protein n=1 Tax=Leptolyngbya sp. FACHB-36 TaxID=2692808 RepID=UPI0016810D19|nr:hypothetical protein [Leptolyngbya sp. FACHB-36]MBD2019263.1 hypothetical protein [Leptolyngbya sp. FACHB-36]
MIHWTLTAALLAIAYWLGRRHGWKDYEQQMSKALNQNQIAFKLGVPPDHEFWSDHAVSTKQHGKR